MERIRRRKKTRKDIKREKQLISHHDHVFVVIFRFQIKHQQNQELVDGIILSYRFKFTSLTCTHNHNNKSTRDR